MPVRSTRLLGPTLLPTTAAALYTVPSGRTAIVRQISIVNSDSVTRTAFLYIGGSGVGNRWRRVDVASGVSSIDSAFGVLNPGDVLQGNASAANVLTVTIMGALLDGEPT